LIKKISNKLFLLIYPFQTQFKTLICTSFWSNTVSKPQWWDGWVVESTGLENRKHIVIQT